MNASAVWCFLRDYSNNLVAAYFEDRNSGSQLIFGARDASLIFDPGNSATEDEPLRKYFELIGTDPTDITGACLYDF